MIDIPDSLRFLLDAVFGNAYAAASIPTFLTLRTLGFFKPKSILKQNLSGKIAIVTGSNKGIGKRTSLHLAEMGATVIMAVRSEARGGVAKSEIIEELISRGKINPILEVMRLDLSDTSSIRDFARAFKQQYGQLDILVNNAGTCIPGTTKEGYQKTFAVNHLGHFLLTELLYERLKDTPGARLVNVTCIMHSYGSTSWEQHPKADINEGKIVERDIFAPVNTFFGAYCDSKLANVLHALEIRRRFMSDGVTATAFAVNPGECRTDIYKVLGKALAIFNLYMKFAFLTPEQGCHTSVTVATAPIDELRDESGKLCLYFQPYASWKGHFWIERPMLGPFIGTQPGVPNLPPNSDVEAKKLVEMSGDLIREIESANTRHVMGRVLLSPLSSHKISSSPSAPKY